jgi:isocitrate/isopropylmalate dehydrogenase
MQSAALMLEYLGEQQAAAKLQGAIERVYREGKCFTVDLGGTASTGQFTDAVVAALGG